MREKRREGERERRVGLLVRRIDSYGPVLGLVVGAFQEGIQKLFALQESLADYQLKCKGLVKGREGSDSESSVIQAKVK